MPALLASLLPSANYINVGTSTSNLHCVGSGAHPHRRRLPSYLRTVGSCWKIIARAVPARPLIVPTAVDWRLWALQNPRRSGHLLIQMPTSATSKILPNVFASANGELYLLRPAGQSAYLPSSYNGYTTGFTTFQMRPGVAGNSTDITGVSTDNTYADMVPLDQIDLTGFGRSTGE